MLCLVFVCVGSTTRTVLKSRCFKRWHHQRIQPATIVWNAKLTETQIFSELSIEIESSLIELKSSLIQLKSSLIQLESSLIQLESSLIQLESSLIQLESTLYMFN